MRVFERRLWSDCNANNNVIGRVSKDTINIVRNRSAQYSVFRPIGDLQRAKCIQYESI